MKKRDLERMSNTYAKVASRHNPTKTHDLTARAKDSLAAVSDVYSVASDATSALKTLLAQPDLTSKQVLQLTTALKSISSVLSECREEARRTVADMQSPAGNVNSPEGLTPPSASDIACDAVHTTMSNFSEPHESVRYFPTSEDLREETRQEARRVAELGAREEPLRG